MSFDPLVPYNDLPGLPPKADIETRNVLRKAIVAGRALAELKGLGETIPNQAILVNSLILQEARASSEIENIVTTNDALFQAFSAKTTRIDPATKEVLRYREALWEGYHALKRRPLLSTDLFIRIVQTIKQDQAGIRNAPGTKVTNMHTGEIIFTPPAGPAVIRKKLKELEDFIQDSGPLDPLIKLALIHYQFEAIHPFFDGNGRTGRIVNILYLVQTGLLDLPVIYLSKPIIERKSDYYRMLRGVSVDGDWEPWIIFMLEAVEQASVFSRQRIMDIRALMLETLEYARQTLPGRVYSKELIELIFMQPYTKGQFLVNAGIAKRQTAAEYLKALADVGILKGVKMGKEVLYLNERLYALLGK